MVKRFESSFGSFEKVLKILNALLKLFWNLLKRLEMGDYYKGEYILDRSLLEKIYNNEPEEIEKVCLSMRRK